jgi:nicotinamidase-related amidase
MTPSDTALVIIDVQKAFFEQPTPLHPADLIAKLQGLIAKARAAGVPVMYVQHNESGEWAWVNDTPMHDVHPDIAPEAGDLIFQKWQPDIFPEGFLQPELEQRGIRRLVLAGCQTEHCIQNSCRSGAALGYEIILAGDAHGTFDGESQTAAQIIAAVTDGLRSVVTVKDAADIAF